MFKNINKILCIGAHSDDIEIGCLGTLLSIGANIKIDFIVACGDSKRKEEQMYSREQLSKLGLNVDKLHYFGFEDGALMDARDGLKRKIRETGDLEYDLIFTHYNLDRHQDHRVVGEITLEVFRHSQILSYEVPKFDGCTFNPSYYVTLNDQSIDKKIAHLAKCFKSQHDKYWYKEKVFRAIATIRGVESRSEWAEAFVPVKVIYPSKLL